MFKYSLDNKRYHTLNYFYKSKFNKKIAKIPLNGGFSCPNKVNGSGCIFCSLSGSGDFAGDKTQDLVTQFNEEKKMYQKKWKDMKYIGYFQANTNTYAKVDKLKSMYETVLSIDDVVGLAIATRSDAIEDDVFEYLCELNKRTFLTIELGLQSSSLKTLEYINRGHSLKNFEDMVIKLRKNNINTVVHIINGLPGESKKDMLNTVKYLNNLGIDGIKIHMLYIIKDTLLDKIYKEKPFHILSLDEYKDIVCDQLEILDENIVIHRITGDPDKKTLVEPSWLLDKFSVLNSIDKEMERRGTNQGYKKKTIL
ncbi:MAG: TIGR01212 family radical SAM protein [Bacilli bacterium]